MPGCIVLRDYETKHFVAAKREKFQQRISRYDTTSIKYFSSNESNVTWKWRIFEQLYITWNAMYFIKNYQRSLRGKYLMSAVRTETVCFFSCWVFYLKLIEIPGNK